MNTQKNDVKLNDLSFSPSFLRAKAKVGQIKRLYNSLAVFVFANSIIMILKIIALRMFRNNGVTDIGFLDWFNLNILLIPIFWGIGLLVHAFIVFKTEETSLGSYINTKLRKWEVQQIQKYINQDKEVS